MQAPVAGQVQAPASMKGFPRRGSDLLTLEVGGIEIRLNEGLPQKGKRSGGRCRCRARSRRLNEGLPQKGKRWAQYAVCAPAMSCLPQ